MSKCRRSEVPCVFVRATRSLAAALPASAAAPSGHVDVRVPVVKVAVVVVVVRRHRKVRVVRHVVLPVAVVGAAAASGGRLGSVAIVDL